MTFSGRLTWPNEPIRAVALLRPRSVRRAGPQLEDPLMVTGLTQFEPRRLRQKLINRDAFDGGRDLGLVAVFRDDSHRRWIGDVSEMLHDVLGQLQAINLDEDFVVLCDVGSLIQLLVTQVTAQRGTPFFREFAL